MLKAAVSAESGNSNCLPGQKLHSMGVSVDVIAGFRNKDIIILEKKWLPYQRLFITTDDGSNGTKGFIGYTATLLDEGNKYDVVIAIGPQS